MFELKNNVFVWQWEFLNQMTEGNKTTLVKYKNDFAFKKEGNPPPHPTPSPPKYKAPT